MSEFEDRIRKSVQAARASVEQQRDVQRRQDEEAAGLQEQNRQRAFELREPIWGRIRDAAHVSDGAITVDRNGRAALTTFHLWWQEGQPDRALRIVVDETEGHVQASWVVAPGYGHSVDAPSAEASRLTWPSSRPSFNSSPTSAVGPAASSR